MITDLEAYSDAELISLFRKENESNRNRITKYLLFEKKVHGKTWNQKIWVAVTLNKDKLSIDSSNDVDDLYQEAVQAFHKTLSYWFDIESGYGLSTYVWPAINSAINRVFQKITKTKKRIALKEENEIEINLMYDNNKKFQDVISNKDVGNLKSQAKEEDFERVIFYRDIIDFLKLSLSHENIDADKNLIKDLTSITNLRKNNNIDFNELSRKYRVKISYIKNIRNLIVRNIEKSMYKDFMSSFEYNVKSKDSLAKKYNCSKTQISKQIDLMNKQFKKQLLKIDLHCKEIFS